MANYTLSKDFESMGNSEIYNALFEEISKKKSINSITGVEYDIDISDDKMISFSAPSRNGGKAEYILKDEFETVFNELKGLDLFNTSSPTLKKNIPNRIYKKRSPLFALLLAGGIIEKS